MVRTASAAGRFYLIKRPTREYLVQFQEVSSQYAHSAVIRYHDEVGFQIATIPLRDLSAVNQEAAKALWLLQTGEEV